MRSLLMFCCFLSFVFLNSCKESTTTDTAKTEKEATTTEAEDQNMGTGTLLFFGDSLTAGYGVESSEAFPALIQQKIDSLNMDFQVVNAGLSGETTAGGLNRIDWVLKQPVDVFVLELGANDGLRGLPLTETRKNLQAIIDYVKKENPQAQIVLAGMQLPPNLGTEYTKGFSNIFPELAEKNNVVLIPFLLKDVGGIAELNQEDRIHPTPAGHKIIAATIWPILKPLVEKDIVN